jgi:hypothetical protein
VALSRGWGESEWAVDGHSYSVGSTPLAPTITNNQSSPIPGHVPLLGLRRCARVRPHLLGSKDIDPLERRLGEQLVAGRLKTLRAEISPMDRERCTSAV